MTPTQSRAARQRALHITITVLWIIAVCFFGLRMCAKPAKAQATKTTAQTSEPDFNYFAEVSRVNAQAAQQSQALAALANRE